MQFLNPWITPEPRRHPWIEWQEKLMLERAVLEGVEIQIQLSHNYQQNLQVLYLQLLHAQDELQQRNNQLLHREAQLRYETHRMALLQNCNRELINDLGAARKEKRANRDVAMDMIRKITNVFNESIPKLQ